VVGVPTQACRPSERSARCDLSPLAVTQWCHEVALVSQGVSFVSGDRPRGRILLGGEQSDAVLAPPPVGALSARVGAVDLWPPGPVDAVGSCSAHGAPPWFGDVAAAERPAQAAVSGVRWFHTRHLRRPVSQRSDVRGPRWSICSNLRGVVARATPSRPALPRRCLARRCRCRLASPRPRLGPSCRRFVRSTERARRGRCESSRRCGLCAL
jgi:hypothetical protein